MFKLKKEFIIVGLIATLIFFFAAGLRFYKLGIMPEGVTNDEANYIYNAYSIWKTQHDVNGSFLPLSTNLDSSYSPVPIYLISPIVGIFGVSPFTGRLLNATVGTLSVLLVFLIAQKLFKNNIISFTSMFAIAFSPWHIHFSRSAYEGLLALFFILLGTYIFILGQKNGKFYYSMIVFFLAFFSYHATKIFLVVYIPLLLFVFRESVLKFKKSALLYGLGFITILAVFVSITVWQGVNRQNVLLFSDTKTAASAVNTERKLSSAPLLLKNIYNNKALYFLRTMRENYLESFSPQFLFLYGETSGVAGIYGTGFRGVLYILDLPFIFLGLIYIYIYYKENLRDRKQGIFLIATLFIAALPSAFTIDRQFALRNIMLLPIFSILIGCGIYYLFREILKTKKILLVSSVVMISGIYLFLITSYLYQYYYRYSISGAESWFQSSKDLVEYIETEGKKHNQIVLADSGNSLIQYAIHTQADPRKVQKTYKQKALAYGKAGGKTLDNVIFINGCIDTKDGKIDLRKQLTKNMVYITTSNCHFDVMPDNVISDKAESARVIWKIYKNN